MFGLTGLEIILSSVVGTLLAVIQWQHKKLQEHKFITFTVNSAKLDSDTKLHISTDKEEEALNYAMKFVKEMEKIREEDKRDKSDK